MACSTRELATRPGHLSPQSHKGADHTSPGGRGCLLAAGKSSELPTVPAGRCCSLRQGAGFRLGRSEARVCFVRTTAGACCPHPKERQPSTSAEPRHTHFSFQLSLSVLVQQLLPFLSQRLLLCAGEEEVSVTVSAHEDAAGGATRAGKPPSPAGLTHLAEELRRAGFDPLRAHFQLAF